MGVVLNMSRNWRLSVGIRFVEWRKLFLASRLIRLVVGLHRRQLRFFHWLKKSLSVCRKLVLMCGK